MRVLIRVDFNVPLDSSYNIIDDSKIIERLDLNKSYKNRIILITHLGDPDGYDENWKVDRVKDKLEDLLEEKVTKVDFSNIGEVEERVLLFENIRFWKEEKENDEEFAKRLAELGDLYINDAFSVSHREHASVDAIKKFIEYRESESFKKEKERIDRIKKPYVLILGGKKGDKIECLNDLIDEVDCVLAGSLMSKKVDDHEKIIKSKGENDLDEESVERFLKILEGYKNVVWCGPLGRYEDGYLEGTRRIVEGLKGKNVYVCGGDSIASLKGLDHDFELVSAGGAFLKYLSEKPEGI